jgi:HAD superfamily hydrolase (TIGR01509 family)
MGLGRVSGAPVGLVIFDCDGVLVDSEPLAMRVLLQTIAEAGADIDAEEGYEAFLGKSLATTCELLRRDYQVHVDAAALALMRTRLHRAFRRELRPIPGVADVLAGLGRPLCIASSSRLERIELALEVTGLRSFFHGNIFSASMVARGKPAPDLFLHAAREMRVAPADCIVVEDSPAGITAALAAGMGVFGFTGGGHASTASHRQSLTDLGPRLIFEDMRELPDLVRKLEETRTAGKL